MAKLIIALFAAVIISLVLMIIALATNTVSVLHPAVVWWFSGNLVGVVAVRALMIIESERRWDRLLREYSRGSTRS